MHLVLATIGGLMLIFLIVPPVIVYHGKSQIYADIDDVTPTTVGIVFGAGVHPDGTPTDMLTDRLIAAQQLYAAGSITKILVSGDNRTSHYNEPQAMYNYLVEHDVPPDDIVRDYAGRRTYDTCYRAHEIFGVDQAILISQGYHLPRAIYLCTTFGIDSTGYSATFDRYQDEMFYKAREIIALYWSVLDVMIIKPVPVLGEPIDL